VDVLAAVVPEPAAVGVAVLAHQLAEVADVDVEVAGGVDPVAAEGAALGDLLDEVADVVGVGVVAGVEGGGGVERSHGVPPSRVSVVLYTNMFSAAGQAKVVGIAKVATALDKMRRVDLGGCLSPRRG
jgi:hypothetical protein